MIDVVKHDGTVIRFDLSWIYKTIIDTLKLESEPACIVSLRSRIRFFEVITILCFLVLHTVIQRLKRMALLCCSFTKTLSLNNLHILRDKSPVHVVMDTMKMSQF